MITPVQTESIGLFCTGGTSGYTEIDNEEFNKKTDECFDEFEKLINSVESFLVFLMD